MKVRVNPRVGSLAVASVLMASWASPALFSGVNKQQGSSARAAVAIDPDDIGGVVTSATVPRPACG